MFYLRACSHRLLFLCPAPTNANICVVISTRNNINLCFVFKNMIVFHIHRWQLWGFYSKMMWMKESMLCFFFLLQWLFQELIVVWLFSRFELNYFRQTKKSRSIYIQKLLLIKFLCSIFVFVFLYYHSETLIFNLIVSMYNVIIL